jgi:SAM-dependent methyltransferase
MLSVTPSLDPHSARLRLEQLIKPDIDAALFKDDIRRLDRMHNSFIASCPPPWPAPGLVITPEIRCQSELYLPIAEIAAAFRHLYQAALTFSPVLSSSPFHSALSWSDLLAALPERYQFTANPARLLDALLNNRDLLEGFIFASFLPRRFYGGAVRYPGQEGFIREWLADRGNEAICCLDAACGDGAGSYGLARLLLDQGMKPGRFHIDGWTLDPLEVWAAAHVSFPHDNYREGLFRSWVEPVFEANAQLSILFRTVDLLNISPDTSNGTDFDLVLCNGLLGGPIINQPEEMQCVVNFLSKQLRSGGLLLTADNFHGGWKKKTPREALGDMFTACGLTVREAGEGIAGLKGR